MTRLVVLVACLAVVAGCAGQPRDDQVDAEPSPRSTPAAPAEPAAAAAESPVATPVSTAAPTRPYVLKGRLHVDGRDVPGRFGGLVTRGGAWLAYRMDGPPAWGVGPSVHSLAPGAEARLSPNGRWLAVLPGFDACMGNTGGSACTVRLLDTSGKDHPRRHTIPRTLSRRPGATTQVDVLGVTGRGVVVLNVYDDGDWQKLYWDALGGARTLQSRVDGGDVTNRELGSEPEGVGPGRQWALRTGWAHRGSGFSVRTSRVLEAHRITSRRATVRLHTPRGWSFAASNSGNLVFWESPASFLVVVVDSRGGGDRLARCDIPLGTCVLVAG